MGKDLQSGQAQAGMAIGGPCPKCGTGLMRRERLRVFRSGAGDVAYCARCNAAWEIAEEAGRAMDLVGFKPGPA